MSVFEEILNEDSSVFKNQEIFNIDYFPEVIQSRDKELKTILSNIKPLMNNNRVLDTIIIGNTSTGKTTVVKHALMEVAQFTDIKSCYLNCNIQNTLRKCYFQMFKVLFECTPGKSSSTESIQLEILEKLENESFIVVIDDMTQLSKSDSNKLINELFRANEFYHVNMGVIIIVNNLLFKYSLEKNARSVLQCNEIIFKDYTIEQMYSILKYRCDLGFKEGVINDEQIMKISEAATSYTNLRWALTTLNRLGQKIESENRDKIEDKDLMDYVLIT